MHKLIVSSLCLISRSQGSFPTRLGLRSLICKSGAWQGYRKSSSESRPKTTDTHTDPLPSGSCLTHLTKQTDEKSLLPVTRG